MGDRKQAIVFNNQASEVSKDKSQLSLAYQLFGSSVIADPTFAEGWYQIGKANADMGLLEAAVACYRKQLALPLGELPGDLNPDRQTRGYVNMGHALYHLGRHAEAREAMVKAIELNPNYALCWLNMSLVQSVTGELDESLESARKAYALEPENPVVEMGLAFALMFKGEFADGLKHFEARFPYRLPQFQQYPYPKWQGEANATVLIASEQGLGDALSFARFVKKAADRSKFVHLFVQSEVKRLFSAMFQYVENLDVIPAPAPFPPADYWTTFVSLPVALGLNNDEIKFAPNPLIPKFTAGSQWKSKDAQYHVGIAWTGSAASDINRWRKFPVTMLLPLCLIPGVQLYSLQTGDMVNELHGNGLATLIYDLNPYIKDAGDTLGIMEHLDLIITVESFVGHLAGAIGKECIIAYSYNGRDYRLGARGEHVLWYPNSRCFQQDETADWKPVFQRIEAELRKRVGNLR